MGYDFNPNDFYISAVSCPFATNGKPHHVKMATRLRQPVYIHSDCDDIEETFIKSAEGLGEFVVGPLKRA